MSSARPAARPDSSRWRPALLALALLLTRAAAADDTRYQDYPIGTRAVGMGGAFVAIASDPSGLAYNPAGLCDLKDLNYSVSAALYGLERQASGNLHVLAKGDFSLGTLATLNVIPGEAGIAKGLGKQDEQGSKFAYGFDVSVPSYRTYGTDQSAPIELHTRVIDRTFDIAAGGAWRIDKRWSVGAALHFTLRLFSDTEDALITDGKPDPTVGVYHAEASFTNASVSLLLGVKARLNDGWLAGAALGTPGLRLYSTGGVTVQDVSTNPASTPHTSVSVVSTTDVQSQTGLPLLLRAGLARKRSSWTGSSQLTLRMPISYDRFQLEPAIAQRLQLETRVQRHAVLNLNLGGEYLWDQDLSFSAGVFTDFTSAPGLATNPDNTLVAGSSRLDHVSLYGFTAAMNVIADHSISRYGLSLSYGTGQEAVPVDPTGVFQPDQYTRADVSVLFLYFFIGGTFRY